MGYGKRAALARIRQRLLIVVAQRRQRDRFICEMFAHDLRYRENRHTHSHAAGATVATLASEGKSFPQDALTDSMRRY